MLPPWAVLSPSLAAGLPPMSTVPDPAAIVSGGPLQVQRSPITAAGAPWMIGKFNSDDISHTRSVLLSTIITIKMRKSDLCRNILSLFVKVWAMYAKPTHMFSLYELLLPWLQHICNITLRYSIKNLSGSVLGEPQFDDRTLNPLISALEALNV